MRAFFFIKTVILVALAAVAIVAPRSALCEEPEVGFVADVQGVWVDQLAPNQPLGPYSAVRPNSQIRSKRGERNDFITLRIFGLPDPVQFRCATPTVCDRPVDLVSVLAGQDRGVLDRFATVISVLRTVMGRRPVEQRQFLGRGLTHAPSGIVEVVEEKRIAPAALLRGMPTGALLVQYQAISLDRGPGAVVTAGLAWSGGPLLPLQLRPGLYHVHISAAASAAGQNPPSNEGLVLVVDHTDYLRARTLLQQGEDYLGKLSGVGPVERSIMLGYLMMSLAAE